MSAIGWEYWGIKFDLFLIVFLSLIAFLTIRLGSGNKGHFYRIDQMAGDEGDD